ncbi:MAG: multicopper oxidase family protein [Acidimicrobiales bacterium]|nr:multicopper oxidase family protein [Acidimicrobiales bacterium]
MTYNGSTPGPTLRVRPGDRLRVTLRNGLEAPTNLHVHGLHVSPDGSSDNVFVMVDPGGERVYDYVIPADHPSGTFWYHPHHHGTVAEQVAAGMAGIIVIEDTLDTAAPIEATTERVVVLSDPRIGTSAGVVLASSMMDAMQGRVGDGVLVNGTAQPVVTVATGTMERWRILNASASRYYPLQLDGFEWWQVASDGSRLAEPVDASGLVLAPGERAEVLVAVGHATTATLTTTWQTTTGMGGMGGMGGGQGGGTETVLTLVATGEDVSLPAPAGGLARIESLSQAAVEREREFRLAMGGMMMGGGNGMSFTINGATFDPQRVDVTADLGTVEEWTVTNVSPMAHPFHLHVWPFQVLEASDGRVPPLGWKDVVDVPAGGWVRLRVAFRDFAGRTVYHCHILDHEDRGMMGVIEVR